MATVFGRLNGAKDPPDKVTRLLSEADALVARLAEAEVAAAVAELNAEEAAAREREIAEIDAAEMLGELHPERAEAQREEITNAIDTATRDAERARAVVDVLTRRVKEAGAAVAAEIEREPYAEYARAERQLELFRRYLATIEQERDVAHAALVEAQAEARETLGRYDDDARREQQAKAKRKETEIRKALRQPRVYIQQLPVAWQAEAYERYDAAQADAAAVRERIEGDRYGGRHDGYAEVDRNDVLWNERT